MKHQNWLNHPYFLLMLAPLIWGGNAIVGRMAPGEIAPFTLACARWLVTITILMPFVLPSLKRDLPEIRRHWWLLMGYGTLGFAFFNMLLYASLHYTTAVNATLIQAAIPMLILLLNRLLFREQLQTLQVVGLLLTIIGVALIISQGHPLNILTLSVNIGDAMMLVAALMYALYSIGLRFKPNISWLSFITVSGIGAVFASLPFVIYEVATQPTVIKWSFKSLSLVLYAALFASLIAQLAYAKGVSLIGANRAGLAINLVPVFGALMAVILLNEQFHLYHFSALVLVLGGIALSEYAARQF